MELPHYNSPEESGPLQLTIPVECVGMRLDQALAHLFPIFSRGRWQAQIEAGGVKLAGMAARQKTRVWGGESLWLVCEPVLHNEEVEPQSMALDIVAVDEAFWVIHKPAGLVVHPGHGNRDGTLQNGLLYHDPALMQVPRSGIVHRLDKDTSGLMVVARTWQAHAELVRQLQERSVQRHYWALVNGQPLQDGQVEAPMGRHPQQRTKMAIVSGGRAALTRYQVIQRLPCHSLLECRLATGRTHQIRVHLQHEGFPLAGDPLYGGRMRLDADALAALRAMGRQALHAFRLGFLHPVTGQPCSWSIGMPEDMALLLQQLEQARYV